MYEEVFGETCDEILSKLIYERDENNNNFLHLACRYNSYNPVELIWEKIKKILKNDKEKLKEFLELKGENGKSYHVLAAENGHEYYKKRIPNSLNKILSELSGTAT